MTERPGALLRRFGVRPKKSLGQNFLYDPVWLQRIVAAGEVGPQDVVLEIGPGTGSLTCSLAAVAREVVAIELDERLLPLLAHVLQGCENVTVVAGDILQRDLRELLPAAAHSGFKVVANIPYYITGQIVRHLLQSDLRAALLVLSVQREVADRMAADAGEMSMLAVSVQFYCSVQIVACIPAGAFYPPPEVDSAVVRLAVHPQTARPHPAARRFFRVARAGFAQRRKQLQNALAHGLTLPREQTAVALRAAGVDPRRRAQTLSLHEWARLTDCLPDPSH